MVIKKSWCGVFAAESLPLAELAQFLAHVEHHGSAGQGGGRSRSRNVLLPAATKV
jgi:hypothetical protein